MKRITVRAHHRKGRPVKEHPRRIGSSWKGPGYVHGPRAHNPNQYKKFRLSKPDEQGKRQVFGQRKDTGKWERQSEITPRFHARFVPDVPEADRISPSHRVSSKREVESMIADRGIKGTENYYQHMLENNPDMNSGAKKLTKYKLQWTKTMGD